MGRPDPHSCTDTKQTRIESVALSLRADFQERRLRGEALLLFAAPGGGPLDLDTRGLSIESATDLEGRGIPHRLDAEDPILGARLRLEVPEGARGVTVRYATSPEASALQWLPSAPGGTPFLYTQCQSIHARSVVPLQDSPSVRIRFRLRLTVPEGLRAVAAGVFEGREAAGPGEATDCFAMPEPIPPYLLAFAVGALEERPLSARSRVWATPELVAAAADEFRDVERMLGAAESLFGPYRWGRFDLLVLPPSFPYGGMENPRLAFLSPTLVVGDRSLVNVLAHEVAHAWTGNLVTHATAGDFWLNEGFTVYAERRILEALQGRDAAELHAANGAHDLRETLRRLAGRPERTLLRMDLSGADPDQAYTSVPYEKGSLLLRALEEAAGRPAWDGFLRSYLARFAFRSVATQDFLDHLDEVLPGLSARVQVLGWIDSPGLPEKAPRASSPRLDELRGLASSIAAGAPPAPAAIAGVGPAELVVLLRSLPAPLPATACAALDRWFAPSARRSVEIRLAWALVLLRAGAAEGLTVARVLLLETGRLRHLRALYAELCGNPATRAFAAGMFEQTKTTLHPIVRSAVESLLAEAPAQKAGNGKAKAPGT